MCMYIQILDGCMRACVHVYIYMCVCVCVCVCVWMADVRIYRQGDCIMNVY